MSMRVLVTALALVLAVAPVIASSAHGSVYVSTLPPGASVWMDGNYLGNTPLFVDGLDAGRHFLTLTRSGWQPQSTAVDVVSGHVASVNAVLTANAPQPQEQSHAKGALTVRGAEGAKIFIDGVALTPPYDAQPENAGDHILLVQRGATRTTTSIRIYPDTTTTISLAPRSSSTTQMGSADMLAALVDYVPASDFTVSGDEIAIHHNGMELECTVGSRTYVLNGKPGFLSVAPAMVGGKPYLPMSLLQRISSQNKAATR
ncbi:MAG: PEGA domain-containing protein [Candidatus Eremiobacteraeota bacterium]|nr:PEGA domain-containing protein [Candidatus Eremiobacteraeota bacterium]